MSAQSMYTAYDDKPPADGYAMQSRTYRRVHIDIHATFSVLIPHDR